MREWHYDKGGLGYRIGKMPILRSLILEPFARCGETRKVCRQAWLRNPCVAH